MKKKKFLAVILATVMACSMSLTAMAADGDAATTPKDSGEANDSTGAAIVTGDGTLFNTENDDDAQAKDADTNGADINVWAKVVDGSSPVYKIDIAWGAMKFEYASGDATWNTETHAYDGAAAGTGAWTVTGYLDGTNNQVTVTNHSNRAVSAAFAYTMDVTDGASQFNDDASLAASVKGNFFADNDKAVTAASVLDDTATVADIFTEKLKLHSADNYYTSESDAQGKTNAVERFTDENKVTTGREDSVYFAFSGKPDTGKGATLNNFTKVGVITVTVAPLTTAELADFEY